MEHADPVPSTTNQSASSSKKRKPRKDKKKRKHDDVAASSPSPLPTTNGTKNGSSSTGKKKKRKDKKKPKKEQVDNNADSVEKVDASSEQEQQQQQISTNAQAQDLSPPSAAEIQTLSSQKQPATTTGPGSIFSLSATSSGSSKQKKSPYQIKTIQGSVALLPSSLPDVPGTIRSLLHSLLLMYDANMGGVLLSLEEEGVKLLPIDDHNGSGSSSGLIGGRMIEDLPYVHYRFQVKGLLFCPVGGMKLKGQVVECTPTFITLTTHHILSTKISTERLHEVGFFYNSTTLEWTRERDSTNGGGGDDENEVLGPSTSIYLDDIVEFVVGRIHECGGYISLDGTNPSVSTLG